jgi:hypothetical protein
MHLVDVRGTTAQGIPWRARAVAGASPAAWMVEVQGRPAFPLTFGGYEPRTLDLVVKLINTAIAERFEDLSE